ncbi:MAG: endonuclease domain-containing protein [Hyphomicrobiaceae bacterium]
MPNTNTKFARSLRRRQTDVEAKLWARLRDRRLANLKFRRQVPMGSYVVDFLCDEAMLVVELDGGGHGEAGQVVHDEKRTAYLNELGYDVLRVWNNAINQDINNVLEGIYIAAKARLKSPHPAFGPLLPQGEGDNK